jgi:peptide/nickel transport system substrate-binding protein
MISMQSFLDNGKEYVRQNPVGTGPFVLSEWNPGQSIKYAKNENYWQEGKPYLDGVEYYAITDTMTQNAAMQSTGDDGIDLFACSNAEQAYTLISSGVDFDSSHIRGAGTLTLAPNSVDEDSPFYDLRVRQAVACAIDREAICEATASHHKARWHSPPRAMPAIWRMTTST